MSASPTRHRHHPDHDPMRAGPYFSYCQPHLTPFRAAAALSEPTSRRWCRLAYVRRRPDSRKLALKDLYISFQRGSCYPGWRKPRIVKCQDP